MRASDTVRVFDFRALFDKERIPYIERGANVKRGEANIRCPWCGAADPSMHLGINLTTGWYSCWRHKEGHSGKSPLRLLMRLLHVSYGEARELAGLGEGYVDPEGYDALAARIMGRGSIDTAPIPKGLVLEPDPGFYPIMQDDVLTRRFYLYLYGRYFDDVEDLSLKYNLMADRKASRVIIPYTLDGCLTGWTGRAIGNATIKYLDLPRDRCVVPLKESIYNFDEASKGGCCLVVVEGQIDVLKLDHYASPFDVHAVGLSTNSITPAQLYLLEELAAKYPQVVVMMDNKTTFGFVDSMRMKQELSTLRTYVTIASTPFHRSDPGELRPGEVQAWAKQVAGGHDVRKI